MIQGEEPPPEPQVEPGPDDVLPEPDAEEDQRSQLLAAARSAFVVDATRACKRLGLHARRAAKAPDKFLTWLDEFRDEHASAVDGILSPSLVVCGIAAGSTAERLSELSGEMFRSIHDGMLSASDATPDLFAAAVEKRMTQIETTEPARLADMLIETRTTYHPTKGQDDGD